MQFFFYAYTTQSRSFQSVASVLEFILVPSYNFLFALAGMFQFRHLVFKLRYSVFSIHSICESFHRAECFYRAFYLTYQVFHFQHSWLVFLHISISCLISLPCLASSALFHPAVCVPHHELIFLFEHRCSYSFSVPCESTEFALTGRHDWRIRNFWRSHAALVFMFLVY